MDLCIYGSMIVVYLALSTLLRDSMVYVLEWLLRYLCIGTQQHVSPFGLLQVQLTRYKTQSCLRL